MFGNSFNISIGGGNNKNQRVKGDSNSPLNSKNGNIIVSGNNKSSINSKNGNISVSGDNEGDNEGEIDCKNGNIHIGGYNNSNIGSKNGTIYVGAENNGQIDSKNEAINILGVNKSIINNQNGGISVGGTINIVGGNINGIVMSGNGNMTIIDGEVWIDGVKQNGNESANSNNNEYKVIIDDIIIDFENKTATKDNITIDILSNDVEPINLVGNDITVKYKDQSITIYKDYVNVKGV